VGYLDNTTVTVDAILTNKGREILAAGGRLNIVKFALSDDEIDYDLWNPAHTLGTNYYGKVIEDMPVLEALPDETQMLRYKLITLPKDVIGIPVISVQPTAVTFTSLTQEITIQPSTLNLQGANSVMGYTVILSDDTVATLEVSSDGGVSKNANTRARQSADRSVSNVNDLNANTDLASSATGFIDDEITSSTTQGKSITRVGTKFVIKAKPQANTTKTVKALLTIVGNETGGFKTVVVTVDPTQFNTLDIGTSLAPLTPNANL
tara:strand:+ start:105 stop:896 length:792 start_codon:yes stop_codon:yes gene_type:complete